MAAKERECAGVEPWEQSSKVGVVSGATHTHPAWPGRESLLLPAALPLLTGSLHACLAPGVGEEFPGFLHAEGLMDSANVKVLHPSDSYAGAHHVHFSYR